MINFKITIPGTPVVKKNTATLSFFYWTKRHGARVKVPRDKPVWIYSKPYVRWARESVQKLAIFKNNNSLGPEEKRIPFPIAEALVLTCIFFIDDYRLRDLSALMEGPQDMLSGKAGGLPKDFDHETYKIIVDDNKDIIKNLGGSTVMFDPKNPRTEIYLTSWDLGKWGQVMNLLHPGLPIIRPDNSVPQMMLNFKDVFGSDNG